MEIISYVGSTCSQKNSRNNSPNFTAFFKKKSNGVHTHKTFDENRQFHSNKKAQLSNENTTENTEERIAQFNASYKSPLPRRILQSLSIPMNFITENINIISISFAAMILLMFSGAFISNNFHFSHSLYFPVSLETSDAIDLKNLNSRMSAFALSENLGYNSDGTIDGAKSADLKNVYMQPLTIQTYKVKQCDTIIGITKKFNLNNISTVIALNNIDNVRQLVAGQNLKIPSTDGLFITVQKGDCLAEIASKYNVSMEQILDINDLENSNLKIGEKIFIPGAKLDRDALQNALGELFKMPLAAKFRYTSMFGARRDPITGAKSNHKGVDMACPTGTPVLSSCSGTVAIAGYSNLYGNYVVIKHVNGYQTLYGHMSKLLVKKGQWVSQGTRIGLVGSTGYSTGPHLHFTVYKNGSPIDPLSVIKK